MLNEPFTFDLLYLGMDGAGALLVLPAELHNVPQRATLECFAAAKNGLRTE